MDILILLSSRGSIASLAGCLLLFLISCGVEFDLPTATNGGDPVFGAGDTSYIRISPDWDASNGYSFSSPWDIIVGADGYIFIADHAQPRIHVISPSGTEEIDDDFGNDFTDLADLRDSDGNPIFPFAIDQDSRLNLFIADSSNRLLVWNQYLNNIGVDSIMTMMEMTSPTNESLWVSRLDSIASLQLAGWEANDVRWSADNLEYWQKPHLFWDLNDPVEASKVARYFVDPDSVRVTGVSSSGDMCYVADARASVILGLRYLPVALIMTGTGEQILTYRGSVVERKVSSGTGNGTVNDPRGMTFGKDGGLFYTQWGENFSVHKVGGSAGFEYGEDDIMEIERYQQASDISLDPLGNIYVADTGNNRIQQFNASGRFVFNIGMSQVLIDSTIIDSVLVDFEYQTLEIDTTFQIEVADILNGPRSVAIDGVGIVYIADTKNQRVMRYRLSTELDYSILE